MIFREVREGLCITVGIIPKLLKFLNRAKDSALGLCLLRWALSLLGRLGKLGKLGRGPCFTVGLFPKLLKLLKFPNSEIAMGLTTLAMTRITTCPSGSR